MVKKAILIYDKKEYQGLEDLVKVTKEKLGTYEMKTIEIPFEESTKEEIAVYLRQSDADVLVTFDMAGFHMNTLLETSLYNILPAKQLHLLIDEQKIREYKEYDFALNLFVALPKKNAEEVQIERTSTIPNVISHPLYTKTKNSVNCSADNINIINRIIETFYETL